MPADANRSWLVLNPGSSSIKWVLFSADQAFVKTVPQFVERGKIDIKGDNDYCISLRELSADCNLETVIVRFVHGGIDFQKPIKVDDRIKNQLSALTPLAPLHNSISMALIQACCQQFSCDIYAVFDTAFFSHLPTVAQTYGLPIELIEKLRIRRFGFHGFAHQGMLQQWQKQNPDRSEYRVITAQLGSGCSMAAIKDGKPIDNTMGLTPNEGLLMRTRSGDIDPGLITWLQIQEGYSPEDIDRILNHESGWKGLSGGTDNMADVFANDDPRSKLAFDLFRYRFQKSLGSYFAILGGLDAVVLSGGVAENNPQICRVLLSNMTHLGISLAEHFSHTDLPLLLSNRSAKVSCIIVNSGEEVAMFDGVRSCFMNSPLRASKA